LSDAALAAARAAVRGAAEIVSFTGAGLSAESGIPTFRDGAGGLWAKFDPARLASPEGFRADPDLVLDWYAWRRRCIAEAEPNAAHRALAARADVEHVTQNVDDLLARAGAQRVVSLHGTITEDRCHAGCGHAERVDLAEPPERRACPRCGAPMRPAVVWFGEPLPEAAWHRADAACRGCDLLLVVGTSAVVYPAAGLIGLARQCGATVVVVNVNPSDASGLADHELIGKAGDVVPELLG
jgi:NAD-dependent deacetylase